MGRHAWADWLNYGGHDDWRLWTVTDNGNDACNFSISGTNCGFNVGTATGELAHLLHDVLGNESLVNPDLTANDGCSSIDPYCVQSTRADGVTIINLQSDVYWSGTKYMPEYTPPTNSAPKPGAWDFFTNFGNQFANLKDHQYHAWAVRSGDVTTGTVPLPGTLVLMGAGLLGFGALRRRHSVIR